MARKVNWAYEATTDFEALAEYIARDSAFYASAFVQEIRDARFVQIAFGDFGNPDTVISLTDEVI